MFLECGLLASLLVQKADALSARQGAALTHKPATAEPRNAANTLLAG